MTSLFLAYRHVPTISQLIIVKHDFNNYFNIITIKVRKQENPPKEFAFANPTFKSCSNHIEFHRFESSDKKAIILSYLNESHKYFLTLTNHGQIDIWNCIDIVNFIWSIFKSINIDCIKSVSALMMTNCETKILLAARCGTIHEISVNIKTDNLNQKVNFDSAAPLLGHCSMLMDATLSLDNKYLITCDREYKIRVSHYPNVYNIHTFLLSHDEFVSCISLLQSSPSLLLSGDGNGVVKLWNYKDGILLNTFKISDKPIKSILYTDSLNIIAILSENANLLHFFTLDETYLNFKMASEEFSSNICHCCFDKNGDLLLITENNFFIYEFTNDDKNNNNFAYFNAETSIIIEYLRINMLHLCSQNDDKLCKLIKSPALKSTNRYFENKEERIKAKKRKL